MMQNKKLMILIVLGLIAILSLVRGISTTSKARRKFTTGAAVIQEKQIPVAAKGITFTTRRMKRTNFDSWGTSPFMLRETRGRVFTTLKLNGVLWDEKAPLAIINNTTVEIGDAVGGNTVIDIKEDSVVLDDGTNTFELRLGQ